MLLTYGLVIGLYILSIYLTEEIGYRTWMGIEGIIFICYVALIVIMWVIGSKKRP